MRVVSQNRDLSFEFERTVLSVNDTCVRARIGDRDVTIGIYESDKRAKEVFDELHEVYERNCVLLPSYASKGFTWKTLASAYHMPEE